MSWMPEMDKAAMRQYAAEATITLISFRHTPWGRFGVRGDRCACCGQAWPCDVQVLLNAHDALVAEGDQRPETDA